MRISAFVFSILALCYFPPYLEGSAILDLIGGDLEQRMMGNLVRYALNLTFSGSSCLSALQEVNRGLKKNEEWALEMIDSAAKIHSGFLKGNVVNFGNFDECLEVRNPSNTIQGQYCIITVTTPMKLGDTFDNRGSAFGESVATDSMLFNSVCIPDDCTSAEIVLLFNTIKIGTPLENFTFETSSMDCSIDEPIKREPYDVAVFTIFIALIAWVAICTVIHITRRDLTTPFLIQAYSLYHNVEQLFKITERKEGNIGCLHGLRVIALLWVFISHRMFVLASNPVNMNNADISDIFRTYPGTIVTAGQISVDCFFVLSGILISYLMIKQIKKGTVSWVAIFIHRYIRLTVALVALLVFTLTLLKYFGSGPWHTYFIKNHIAQNCDEYWWSLLLFVQNYVNPSKLCLGHTWYLSVDMQLFITAPIILTAVVHLKKLAHVFLISLLILSHAASWYVVNDKNVKVASFALGGITAEDGYNWNEYYYAATHTRASPWIIGIYCGYIIYMLPSTSRISKMIVVPMWIIATILCFGSVLLMKHFVESDYEYDPFWDHLYLVGHRTTWSLGLCWVIIACHTGYGGPVNWFFSLNMWIPLSRVSYGAYLFHTIEQLIFVASLKTNTYFSVIGVVNQFIADVVIIFFAGTLVYLIIECPIFALESAMWKSLLTEKKTLKIKTSEPFKDEKGIVSIVFKSDQTFNSTLNY